MVNLVFTGTYEHTIDPNGRLSIPIDVRAQLQRAAGRVEGENIELYAVIGGNDAVSLYTLDGFERRAAALADPDLEAYELLEYERVLFSLAQRVEVDRQGRVRLPMDLLDRTGLKGDVVLLGVKDHLEVRDRVAWKAYLDSVLASRGDALMNPRRFIRGDDARRNAPQGGQAGQTG